MKLRLLLASLLVIASLTGCKKKKSDATTDQGSGSAMTASGSDSMMTPPPSGSGSAAGSGSATASGSSTGSGSATGSGSSADSPDAVDPAVLAKIAAIKADSLIDASGKPEVPVKGSIQDYVTALAHANGVGTSTVSTVGCGGAGGECVMIAGEAVDPKLLGNKKALRKAIDSAYSEAP